MTAKIDIRLVPDMTPEEIIGKLKAHLAKRGFGDIEVNVNGGVNYTSTTSADAQLIKAQRRVYQEAGVDPLLWPRSGGSWPGSVFTGDPLKLAAGHFGLGFGDGAHAPNEFYLIESSNPKLLGMQDAVKSFVDYLYALPDGVIAMTLYGLITFCVAYVLAVASPGPGVAAVLARSLGHGLRGAPAFIAGFVVGDLVWFFVAATGLAALAQTAQAAIVVIKYVGVAYLLYLAIRLWTAPATPIAVDAPAKERGSWRLFLGSTALTLGNPKTMLFFLALLPTVVPLESLTVTEFLEIAALMCVLLPLVLGGYAVAAARARQLFTSSKAIRTLNRSAGTAMAGAAVVIALRD